jgi:hypothetical protein
MTAAVAADQRYFAGGRAMFLPLVLVGAGIPVGTALLSYGLWRLLRSADLRPYRFLGATAVGLTTVFLVIEGHSYYLSGLFALCWAAAAVELGRGSPVRWMRWVPTWPVYVVSAVIAVVVALPVRPVSMLGPTDLAASGSVGWPELTDMIASVYRSLPSEPRQDAVVVTAHYWPCRSGSVTDSGSRGRDCGRRCGTCSVHLCESGSAPPAWWW